MWDRIKLYIARASGAVSGPYPTKSLGAGLSKPCAYFISFACSHPAGNWRFKSVPKMFAFQPFGKGISGKLSDICLAFLYADEFWFKAPVTRFTPIWI